VRIGLFSSHTRLIIVRRVFSGNIFACRRSSLLHPIAATDATANVAADSPANASAGAPAYRTTDSGAKSAANHLAMCPREFLVVWAQPLRKLPRRDVRIVHFLLVYKV
jgi:hypothetical protein